MKIGIMQPYFFPYIGYWQLISAVDIFVVYDNIEYTKKGWINRNNYLVHGCNKLFTVPLEKASDFLNIDQREISKSFDRNKMVRQFTSSYYKAPFYEKAITLVEQILNYEDRNLFSFLFNSIVDIMDVLNLNTKLIISSSLSIDHNLKSTEKVIAICKELNATTYINSIGGIGLYSKNEFSKEGIQLSFLKSGNIKYTQFSNDCFVPSLSILDILMFNCPDIINEMLKEYILL